MEPKNSTKNSGVSAPKTEAEDLQFPDWSGMDRFTPRLSTEAALRRNDEFLASLPPEVRKAALRNRKKCEVEFIL